MSEIVESVASVTRIIDQISGASEEQSNGIGQVNQAISQMEQAVQQNAAVVEQASAAADSMRLQAQRLQEVVGVFKLDENDVILLNRRNDPARDPGRVPRSATPAAVSPSVKPAATPTDRSDRLLHAESVAPVTGPTAATRKPPVTGDEGEWKEF